jgi:hypothetical protein
MPTLKEYITLVRDMAPDAEEFANELKGLAPSLFQVIFNRGHGTATEQAGKDKTKLESDLAAANARATTAEEALTKERAKAPDVAAIHEQYKQQLAAKDEEVKKAKIAARETVVNALADVAVSNVRAQMISLRIDPDYAEVLLMKEKVRERINIGDDNSVMIYQKGKQIALQAEDPTLALAQELLEITPPLMRVSGADKGAGTRTGGAGETGKQFFDGLRTDKKKEEDEKPKTRSLMERVSGKA